MIIVGLAGGFFTGTCLRLFGAFHPLEAAFAFVILLRRLVMPANVPEWRTFRRTSCLNDVCRRSGTLRYSNSRASRWSRTTGWQRLKEVMAAAHVHGLPAMPKALRHTFGVSAFQANIPPHLVQRWLEHASLKTVVIVSRRVERLMAARMWRDRSSQWTIPAVFRLIVRSFDDCDFPADAFVGVQMYVRMLDVWLQADEAHDVPALLTLQRGKRVGIEARELAM